MAEIVDEATKEKLKASLWFSIGKIVDEETQRLNTTATPQFIGMLTEMAWTQMENVALDLQTFAHHASRTTIQPTDVLLLTRRNEALEGIIREFMDSHKPSSPKQKSRSGTVNGKAKTGGTVKNGRVQKSAAGKGKAKAR